MKIEDKNIKLIKENYNDGLLDDSSLSILLKDLYNEECKKKIEIQDIEANKKISIIIPTHNRKKELSECIESILIQSYKNFEIIIVDDLSSDGTEELIKKEYIQNPKIKYIKNEINSGPSTSRKNGLKIASGDYVIFCDDDDYYIDKKYFEDSIKIIENENVNMVCANAYRKVESENEITFYPLNFENGITSLEYLINFQFRYLKPLSTFLIIFKMDVVKKANLANMNMLNDASLSLRVLLEEGRVGVNRKIVGIYRIHSKNITKNLSSDFIIDNLNEKKEIYEILKNKFETKKANEWFKEQIKLTVWYYFWENLPNKLNRNKIYKWIDKNFTNGKSLIIFLELKYIKSFIWRNI